MSATAVAGASAKGFLTPYRAPVSGTERWVRRFFWLLAILLGAVQAATYRHVPSSEDVVAYLDLADAYRHGDWQGAINAYWSPLYSWVLGLVTAMCRPTLAWEFPAVKLANYLIYLFALVCFDYFLGGWLRLYRQRGAGNPATRLFPAWSVRACGYVLFLWSALRWTTLAADTPDLCLAALVYLACGVLLRIQCGADHWLRFAALGTVLGAGYLTKAVLFPLAFPFLAVAAWSVRRGRGAWSRLGVALACFLLVAGPFVGALSLTKGRWTFGDTGKLNYSWYVYPGDPAILDQYWQGGPPGSGTPRHPARVLFAHPAAFEFATPVGGTFPSWTDPSYWYEGLVPQFNLRAEVRIVARNALYYGKSFLGPLLLTLLLVGWSAGLRAALRNLAAGWRLLALSLSGLGAYGLSMDLHVGSWATQPTTRYVAPFMALAFAWAFCVARLPAGPRASKGTLVLVLVPLAAVGGALCWTAADDLINLVRREDPNRPAQIAEGMRKLGVEPGEHVAIVGGEPFHVYWARLARVRIIAQVPNGFEFSLLREPGRAELLRAVAATGARALILETESVPWSPDPGSGWLPVGDTNYSAYLFPRRQSLQDTERRPSDSRAVSAEGEPPAP